MFLHFSFLSWLKFDPLIFIIKEIRNSLKLHLYINKRPDELREFLNRNSHLENSKLLLVVAFEQPWILNWLLTQSKVNLKDYVILVFDNSRNKAKRPEIKKVCELHDVPYLALPKNSTIHVNRSHGMAMTWIYENVVSKIRPVMFGFIDHDLIPLEPFNCNSILLAQPCYGRLVGQKLDFWSLWAGYSFFNFDFVKDKKINFLNDFRRGLDTGGKNWRPLYSGIHKEALKFANLRTVNFKSPKSLIVQPVQLVDEKWLHIGGVSYKSMEQRLEFFKGIADHPAFKENWQAVVSN